MTTNKPEIRAFLMQQDGHEPYVSIGRDSNCSGVTHPLIRLSDYERLQAECEELRTSLAESRANDKQAMAYLEAVRGIVGGDSFPEMVGRVKELRVERNGYKLAFKECLEKSK